MAPPFLALPADHCFDYRFLLSLLRGYRSPRDKISLMLRKGEILRLRKGLYVRSPEYGGTVEPREIANVLYGPSYISLEYALSHYGMIPERVETLTSVTSKRSRAFATPLGHYSYAHIPQKAYPVGVTLERSGPTGVLIATREKALCDTLARASNIRTIADLGAFITEDQRQDTPQCALEGETGSGHRSPGPGRRCNAITSVADPHSGASL